MNICKVCGKEYEYKRNGSSKHICNSCRQAYRSKVLKHKAVIYKGGKCEICGYDKCEYALEFHHTDSLEKEFAISHKYNNSWEKIRDELDKCIMICSNCHREIHDSTHRKIDEYEKWITSKEERDKNVNIRRQQKEAEKKALIEKYNISAEQLHSVRLNARKVERPTKDAFYEEYESVNHNKSEMGRRYGVSSRTILKWIKSYEKYGI